jgi:molecular chaperone HscB
MTDHFAALDEPRRPWLDAEALKAKFLALTAQVHPDRWHTASEAARASAHDRYTALNAAYQCLRDPKQRLRHLLELETGARPAVVQQVPEATMELFLEVGRVCREVDTLLAERARITSPLLKVQFFEAAQAATEKLAALQRVLNAQLQALDLALKEWNALWAAAPPAGKANRLSALPIQRLDEVYQAISYLTRWSAQIQERLVQLVL